MAAPTAVTIASHNGSVMTPGGFFTLGSLVLVVNVVRRRRAERAAVPALPVRSETKEAA